MSGAVMLVVLFDCRAVKFVTRGYMSMVLMKLRTLSDFEKVLIGGSDGLIQVSWCDQPAMHGTEKKTGFDSLSHKIYRFQLNM